MIDNVEKGQYCSIAVLQYSCILAGNVFEWKVANSKIATGM